MHPQRRFEIDKKIFRLSASSCCCCCCYRIAAARCEAKQGSQTGIARCKLKSMFWKRRHLSSLLHTAYIVRYDHCRRLSSNLPHMYCTSCRVFASIVDPEQARNRASPHATRFGPGCRKRVIRLDEARLSAFLQASSLARCVNQGTERRFGQTD